MAKRLCSLVYEEAINIIKNEEVVYIPWFIGGNWDKKLKFAGDMYDPVPVQKAIRQIKESYYGAVVWEVDGKYIVTTPSNMW